MQCRIAATGLKTQFGAIAHRPGMLLVTISAITALYIAATEVTKSRFYRGMA
jgi:hypothetical protein